MIPATSTTVPSPPIPHRQTAFVPGRDRTRSRNLAKRPGGDPRPVPGGEPDSPRGLPCWSARPGTVTAQPIRSRGETCPCCRSLNVSPRSLPLCQPRTIAAQPYCKARAPTVMPPRVLGHIRDTAASWHPTCFNAHGVQHRGARRGGTVGILGSAACPAGTTRVHVTRRDLRPAPSHGQQRRPPGAVPRGRTTTARLTPHSPARRRSVRPPPSTRQIRREHPHPLQSWMVIISPSSQRTGTPPSPMRAQHPGAPRPPGTGCAAAGRGSSTRAAPGPRHLGRGFRRRPAERPRPG